MTDKKYKLVRDGTVKTYSEWVQDHCDKYAGANRELAKLNIDFMIKEALHMKYRVYVQNMFLHIN